MEWVRKRKQNEEKKGAELDKRTTEQLTNLQFSDAT